VRGSRCILCRRNRKNLLNYKMLRVFVMKRSFDARNAARSKARRVVDLRVINEGSDQNGGKE
jgi:hypothetical protein